MSICFEKLPHSCGTKKGLQVFQDDEGNFNGYCFSCSTLVPSPYDTEGEKAARERSKAEKVIPDFQAVREEVLGYPILGMPERKLRQESFAYFNIHTSVSEQDGITPVIQYYPYTRSSGEIGGFKARFLPAKSFWCIGSLRGTNLFGWEQAISSGSKRLFITEGELDAVALYQAIKDSQRGTKWESLEPAVVSLRTGSSEKLTTHAQKIRANFQEVVLVFDQDDAGNTAVQQAMQVLPEATVVQCPAKDASAAVKQGRSKALAKAALFRPQKPKNTRLVWARDILPEARKPVPMGLSWPFKQLTADTRGLRFGEGYYFGAGVKMGKGELRNTIIAHFIREHGLKIFLCSAEEAKKKTVRLIAGKFAGTFFHDPNIDFNYEAYDKAGELFGNNLAILDLYQHMRWNAIRPDIMEAISEGCKLILIDPITNLTDGIPSGEANTELENISVDSAAIALDNDVSFMFFCHLKAPESGLPHERGGTIWSTQFHGSRAMMRKCHYMLGLEGNKDPNLPIEQRNMRDLVLIEDREFGVTDRIPLYWDHKTGLFNEIEK